MIDFGKSVQTENGTKVNILTTNLAGEYPILGKTEDGIYRTWDKQGHYAISCTSFSLMNVPAYTVWVNANEKRNTCHVYDSREQADYNKAIDRVARIKVEVEDGRFDI